MVTFCHEHLVFVKAVREKPFVEATRASKGWPAEVGGEVYRTEDGMTSELKRLVATTTGTKRVEKELADELEQARERNPGVEYGAGTYGIDALELCNTMATMASWEVDSTQVQLSDEVLGRGSYGTVYKGTWSAAKVAVKLFSERVADPERMLESVRQEAAFLARMRHPNIIMFMGVCTQPYNLAILTELCERGSLHTVLSQHSHQPATLHWVLRLSMLSEAARGMVYLHNSNPMVIHQDLNPSNLLVDNAWRAPGSGGWISCCLRGAVPCCAVGAHSCLRARGFSQAPQPSRVPPSPNRRHVKVADFGLSTLLSPKDGLLPGRDVATKNAACLAPEVIRGQPYGTPSDVFSFGAVIWSVASMKEPWLEYKYNRFRNATISRLVKDGCGALCARPHLPPPACPAAGLASTPTRLQLAI